MAKEQKKKKARKAQVGDPVPTDAPKKGDAPIAVRESDDQQQQARDEQGQNEHEEASEAAREDVEVGVGDASEGASISSGEGEPEGQPMVAASHLGTARYVMAGFFVAAILLAYVLGNVIHSVWSNLSSRDWFSQALPWLAAVAEDNKGAYGIALGGLIAAIIVVRAYRKPHVRTWSNEVAAELSKVKWPTRKEVSNSTLVVIAASAVATIYLALLDRLWAFVTNIVYGDGS